MIEVRELVKDYPVARGLGALLRGRREPRVIRALDRVSLSVASGEVLGLLGANGAGKTSLIHILCTLLTPSSGSVRVGGHELASEGGRARALIGLVTSNERSFYWRLSGRENLRFFAALFQVAPGEAERRIEELLAALELGEYADRRFDGYSTGIRQRFAFARALLHRPRVLLMDEPSKGLDPRAAAALLELIQRRILALWRPTLLLASHNLTELETLCDRIAILDRGRVLRCGTLAELTRGAADGERVRLDVAGADRIKLEPRLAALLGPGALRVEPQPWGLALELRLGTGRASLSDALRAVLDQGGEIRRCEHLRTSLGEVFRQTLEQERAVSTLRLAASFLRRDAQVALSYRAAFLLPLLTVPITVPLVGFWASVFAGTEAEPLGAYKTQYFSFLVLGLALQDYVSLSMASFLGGVREHQLMGTLEILMLSPTPVSRILLCSSLWSYGFGALRFALYLAVALGFGLDLSHANPLSFALVALGALLSFAALGILGAAVTLLIKQGSAVIGFLTAATLAFGGVAYPIGVLPGWLQALALLLPFTHALSGVRQSLLLGAAPQQLGLELAALAAFAALLLPCSLWAFELALRRAKQTGTLAQY